MNISRRNFLIGAAVAPVAAVGAGVPAMEIARRQSFHTGGLISGRMAEYPAILQPGESILPKSASQMLAEINAAMTEFYETIETEISA